MECISCKKEADFTLKALQLRTMHVRGMTGEDKYQVPDDEVREYGVCRECAQKWIAQNTNTQGQAWKQYGAFAGILCAGILILLFLRQQDTVFLMLGCAAVFCGGAGLISKVRQEKQKGEHLGALSEEELFQEAAWEVFTHHAPQYMKEKQWKLTYIPVNEKTLNTKPGDLTVIYDIQPGVAKEVMVKIGHPQA